MHVLILNASPRPAGIVAQACAAAADAARRAGAEVREARLYALDITLHGLHALPDDGALRSTARCGARTGRGDPDGRPAGGRHADLLGRDGRPPQGLFERLVPLFMGESRLGLPRPQLRGRRAVVIAACTTPWPFNILFGQSRGAVRSVREVLRTGGMKLRAIEIAGTKDSTDGFPTLSAAVSNAS